MRKSPLAYALTIVVVIGLFVVLRNQLSALSATVPLGFDDFRNPWTAGHLFFLGTNPYDRVQEQAVQLALTPLNQSYAEFWYLPWLLPGLLGLGALDYVSARVVWFFLGMVAIVVSMSLTWRLYAGRSPQRRTILLLAASFMPFWMTLAVGQITLLMLLGLVSFLYFERKNLDWAAGACLLPVSIKPQLSFLLPLALLLTLPRSRRWPLAGGAVLAGLALIGLAVLIRPGVLAEYLAIDYSHYGQAYTVGGALAFVTGRSWAQYLPMLAGALWFVPYWLGRRRQWDWGNELPLLSLVSLATAPVAWIFDTLLAWLAVVQVAVQASRSRSMAGKWLTLAVYVLVNGAILALFWTSNGKWHFAWVGPGYLAWYLIARWSLRRSGSQEVGETEMVRGFSASNPVP